jgi:hypothetical protein
VQLFMSAGTLVLGLLMVYLATGSSPELVLFGWVLAGLGLVGVVLRYVLPAPTSRGSRR